jgi:hypothetical protein
VNIRRLVDATTKTNKNNNNNTTICDKIVIVTATASVAKRTQHVLGFGSKYTLSMNRNNDDTTENMSTSKSTNATATADASASAEQQRRRAIEEEMQKIQQATRQARANKMKALLGVEAPSARDRAVDIKEHQKRYAIKGREHLFDEDGNPLPLLEQPPVKSPVTVDSPIKKYMAIAEKNAMTSTIESPSLFGHDPVKSREMEIEQSSQRQNANKVDPRDETSLIPQDWYTGPHFYTLREVRQRLVNVPAPFDKKDREQLLSSEEFQAAFGMSKLEYVKHPKWRRDKLKQQLYLF